jgi:para-nitrobenzyl esterase
MGAYHTAELLYLFPGFHGARGTAHALNAQQETLSDLLVDYWTSFARDGVPSARAGSVRSEWARYTAEADNIQTLDVAGAGQEPGYGRRYHGDLWDAVAAD